MPEQFSKEVSAFIQALLIKDPQQRLGSRGNGLDFHIFVFFF